MKKWIIWFLILLVALAACNSEEEPQEPAPAEVDADLTLNPLTLSSPAFSEGGAIPARYTCDGDDVAPALTWQNAPADVASYTLIMDDPDAPGGTWDHWIVYNIPPAVQELPDESSSDIGVQGNNSWKRSGYGGPCPPRGSTHHYFFKLYALDMEVDLEPGATKEEVLEAMDGHVLAQGQLMGVYER